MLEVVLNQVEFVHIPVEIHPGMVSTGNSSVKLVKMTGKTIGGGAMKSQRVDKLNAILEKLQNNVDEKVVTKLELEKCSIIIERLASFLSDCEECNKRFVDLENYFVQLLDKSAEILEEDLKHHKQKMNDISSHLENQHNLVPSGHYLSIYMSIGISLGLVFGLVIFDNLALGLSIGTGIGIAIGAGLDADVKRG